MNKRNNILDAKDTGKAEPEGYHTFFFGNEHDYQHDVNVGAQSSRFLKGCEASMINPFSILYRESLQKLDKVVSEAHQRNFNADFSDVNKDVQGQHQIAPESIRTLLFRAEHAKSNVAREIFSS